MTIKSYPRGRIPPEVVVPWGELHLGYTDHAMSRMNARSKGSLEILPNMILLAPKNLKQIWTEREEGGIEMLKSMLVEIPYTRGILLQLIISAKGVVITLYFRETLWQKTHARRAEDLRSASTASDTSLGLESSPIQLEGSPSELCP